MKNFKVLSLALLSLFIFSCTEDDENGTTDPNVLTTANLAGVYNVTALNATGSESDTFNGTTTVETFTLVGSDFNNVTLTFTEDGRISSSGTFTTTAVYTENGVMDTEVETSDLDLSGRYSVDGNSLILSESDGSITTINNFSSQGFDLLFEIIDVGPDYRYEAQGTYTLVRQ